MKKILLFLFVAALLGSSCEEEISSSTITKYNDRLVVNEYFNNNEPFSIQVSISKDAYKEPNPFVIDSTKVKLKLTENGVNIPLFYDDFAGVFNSLVKPQPGKRYELTASSSSYGTAFTSGLLPGDIDSKNSVCIENGGIDMQGNKSDLLKLTFKDNAGTKDYYKLNFFYYSELVDKFNAFDFELKDILSAVNTIKTRDGGFLFSDESFSGKEKTFTAVPPFGIVSGNSKIKYLIQIQRLNDDFWKYNTSLEQYRGGLSGGGSGSNIFGGAVVVYTNIQNGLGIFAGSNIESDTIKVK
ncbi:MAG: DUF4249 family protein [Bacteroidia bacterium]